MYYRQKLKNLYSTALSDAEYECDMLRKSLDLVAKIKSLQAERRMAARVSGIYIYGERERLFRMYTRFE